MILANSKYEICRCDHVIISNLFKHTFMIVSIVDSLKMQVQVHCDHINCYKNIC